MAKINRILAIVGLLFMVCFLCSCANQAAKTTPIRGSSQDYVPQTEAAQPAQQAAPTQEQQAQPEAQKCGSGIMHDVKISGFAFTPAELDISRCDTVLWTNEGTVPHTITDDSGELKSAILEKGDKYGHKFENAGTFNYYCSIHPSMTGKIVVK